MKSRRRDAATTYAGTSSSPSAIDPVRAERQRRTRQALINVTCSFMVVLLAAQSWKSGGEKRKAIRQRDEQAAELRETQQRLKAVTREAPAVLAAACARAVIQERQAEQPSTRQRGWFAAKRNNAVQEEEEERKELEAKFLKILTVHLERTVGEAGLTPEERDQKRARESAMSDETLMEVAVALEGGGVMEENSKGETVVKKRVFSI